MTLTHTRPEANPMPRHRLPNSLPIQPARASNTLTAREYAEAWYQCLREPQTHTVPLISSTGTGFGTFIPDLDVGNWRTGGGQTYIRTPAGDRDERAIGRAVYDMLASSRPDDVLYGKLLGRVITGMSMASLLREGGYWHQNRESGIRYALACLTLAVQVDDSAAEEPLTALRRELASIVSS